MSANDPSAAQLRSAREYERHLRRGARDSGEKESFKRRFVKISQSVFTIMEKAPTGAFSWMNAPISAFTVKTLLRHSFSVIVKSSRPFVEALVSSNILSDIVTRRHAVLTSYHRTLPQNIILSTNTFDKPSP